MENVMVVQESSSHIMGHFDYMQAPTISVVERVRSPEQSVNFFNTLGRRCIVAGGLNAIQPFVCSHYLFKSPTNSYQSTKLTKKQIDQIKPRTWPGCTLFHRSVNISCLACNKFSMSSFRSSKVYVIDQLIRKNDSYFMFGMQKFGGNFAIISGNSYSRSKSLFRLLLH